MKILVVCINYYPEPFMVTDFCEELVKEGHDVSVVTGLPNCPMGDLYEGYEKGKNREEVRNGVKIKRCFLVVRKKGIIRRALNYFSFSYFAGKYIKSVKEEYDVVFVYGLSPVTVISPAYVYKKKHKVPLAVYCLDLWPESLTVGGVKRSSIIFKIFKKISERLYKKADEIYVTSKPFIGYFDEKFGIKNTFYLPQYSVENFSVEDCRKEKDENFNVLFAGGIGKAQKLITLIKAAEILREEKSITFSVVGDGIDLEELKNTAKTLNLENVTFYGRVPQDKMVDFYKKADVAVVMLNNDEFISKTLPLKVQGYMSCGKPVIASVSGEAARVIKEANCGFTCPAEDGAALANEILRFYKTSNEERKAFSDNAYKYYKENFTKETFFKTLNEKLTALAEKKDVK